MSQKIQYDVALARKYCREPSSDFVQLTRSIFDYFVVPLLGLHGLDHPGRGDGDPGAESGQRHPGIFHIIKGTVTPARAGI